MSSPKMLATNGQLIIVDSDGITKWGISDNDPLRASYGVFLPSVAPSATPTDLIVIQGSATKTVRIRSVVVTGTATAAANIIMSLVRRSTANTGGTFAPQTLVNRDKRDDAPTCVVNLYTANPTSLGTSLGAADGGRLNIAPAANGGIDRLALQYSWLNDKAPILVGITDFIAINLAGIAWPAGGLLDLAIMLSED